MDKITVYFYSSLINAVTFLYITNFLHAVRVFLTLSKKYPVTK